jgi:hypothetical protein
MIDRALVFFVFALVSITWLLALGAFQLAVTPPSFTKPILVGLSFITLVIFILLKNVKKDQHQNFVLYYLLSIFGKFVIAGIAVFVILQQDAASSNTNVVFFMISYVAFTSLEVTALLLVKRV